MPKVRPSDGCERCHGRGYVRGSNGMYPCPCTDGSMSDVALNRAVNAIGTTGRMTVTEMLRQRSSHNRKDT